MHWLLLSLIFGAMQLNCISAQRVAPGVPPQHYQQPPPQQDYQQQMHHQGHHQQQIPVQQQQHVPMQQQQQHQQPHVQQQHVPVQQHHQPQGGHHQQQPQGHQQQQQPHGHAHHHGQPQQVLNANMADEKAHIAEHMAVPMDTSKMTDQELQFHYFKMHDADNNNKLDGCELIKSLIHWHEQGNKEGEQQQQAEEKLFKDDELVALIDPILNMDDTNKDGFIDYPEFIKAQEKAATTGRS